MFIKNINIFYILICSINNAMSRWKCDVLEILLCSINEFQYIKGFQDPRKCLHFPYVIITLFKLRSEFSFNSTIYP